MGRWWIGLFSLFIILATSFDHSGLFLGVSMICIVVVFFVVYRTKELVWLFLLLCPLLVVLALWFFQRRHISGAPNMQGEATITSFLGTGVIISTLRNERYIFEYDGQELLLYSSDEVSLGDEVYVVGRTEQRQESSFFYFWGGSLVLPQVFQGKFDYTQRLSMKGWQGVIHAKQVIVVGSGELSGILTTRKSLIQRIHTIYVDRKISTLLAGLLIGDVSGMTTDEYQRFIDAGLVHIVAVSGANMVMLIIFLHTLFFFLPYYMRIGAISVVLVWYALVCGLDSSVLRALVMGLLTIIALVGGRVISIWRILAYAYTAMLLRNPYMLLYDLGFSLSFMALVGILFAQELVGSSLKQCHIFLRYSISNYILPTLGASLAVLPPLVFFVGSTNISTLIANILVLPLIPFIMIGGLVSLCLPGVRFLPLIIEGSIYYIYDVADYALSRGVYVTSQSLVAKYVIALGLLTMYGVMIWRVRSMRQEANKNQ